MFNLLVLCAGSRYVHQAIKMLKELYHKYFKVKSCLWSICVLLFCIDFFYNKFVPPCVFPLQRSSLNNFSSTPVTQNIVLVSIFFWWGVTWKIRHYNFSVLPYWRHKSDLLLLKKNKRFIKIFTSVQFIKYISVCILEKAGRCWNFIQKSSMTFWLRKEKYLGSQLYKVNRPNYSLI